MNEDYKINILKLAADGSNWVTYRDHMKFALDMRGWAEHLTETTVTQGYKDASDIANVKPAQCWKNDDGAVRQLIVTSVPDSIFNRIKEGTDVKTIWDTLKKIFEGRTRSLLIDLGRKLQNTKCGEDDDVCAHFELLADFRKQFISNLLNDLECTGCTGASTPVCQFHNWHQFDSVLDSEG